MDNVRKARARMLIKSPFFATLLLTSPFVETESIPTAATDMDSIFYNPKFFAKLTVDQIVFVLAHEVLHKALMHGLRLQGRNHELWNIACDFAINLILHTNGFDLIPDVCFDKKYEGMSAEAIYELLLKDAKSKQKPKGGEADGEPRGSKGLGSIGRDVLQPKAVTSAERGALERKIKEQVTQAATMAKLAGKTPGGMERFLDELLNPSVPWQDLLREYMTRLVQDAESWSRRNRRFSSVYLPARNNYKMGEIIVIGDTSGSIDGPELNKYWTEVRSVSESCVPERVRILWADTEVAGEQVIEDGELFSFQPKPKGGDGTDMRVPLKHAEQYDPSVVILMTDGYTPWPTVEPDFPLIVMCTTDMAVPVGQVVRV